MTSGHVLARLMGIGVLGLETQFTRIRYKIYKLEMAGWPSAVVP